MEHILWLLALSVPIIAIWVILCPLIALLLLYRNIKKEESNQVKQYLLILYQGLRKDKFYWEFVNTLRKILLLFIMMFSNSIKILFSTSLLFLTIRLQLYLKPYKDEENNKIEIMALVAGLVTMMSSIIFISEESVGFINIVILIFIMALNMKFFLEWMYKMFNWARKKARLFQFLVFLLEYILRKQSGNDLFDQEIQNEAVLNDKTRVLEEEEKSSGQRDKQHRIAIKRQKKFKRSHKKAKIQHEMHLDPSNDHTFE